MKSLYETIWYTTVGHTVRHRDNPAPAGPWSDPDLAILALDTWLASEPEASELIAKHRVRVVSYPTQDAAKRANALGHINEGGYERVQGVYGFVRQHKDYDIEPEPTVDNRRTLVGAVLSVVTLVALFGVGLWAWAAPANAAPDNGAAYNLNGADGSHARSTVVVLGPTTSNSGRASSSTTSPTARG